MGASTSTVSSKPTQSGKKTSATYSAEEPSEGVVTTQPAAQGDIPIQIAQAIIAIQKKLLPLVRSSENDEYGSKYTPLHVVMTQALKLLNKHKVGVMQPPTVIDGQAGLLTILVHESGVSYQSATKLALTKVDPQSHGSAITYLRRYSLMATLGLTSEEDDDDGNKASGVQLKPTEEQLEQIKTLCLAMRYPSKQIAAEVWKVKTRDHAALTIRNLNVMVSQKVRDLEASDRALEIEQGIPNEDGVHIPVSTDEPSPDIEARLRALGMTEKRVINKFVLTFTDKPFLANCNSDDIATLDTFVGRLERGELELPDDWLEVMDRATGKEEQQPKEAQASENK
ncbi:ERF family protein [Paeniglutamicibacter sp. NPDC091659]|uniref:ERF family protein n=1 Tax=Paeniglutamicibacter sp. NPDC091659 TaxID=3364389 RepID=UPI003813AA35